MKEPRELAIEMAEFLYTKKGENIQVLAMFAFRPITMGYPDFSPGCSLLGACRIRADSIRPM